MARVGILGGTFNPPHVGHLICGQAAYEALGLDLLLLVPAAAPPHKEVVADPGIEERVRLCELAIDGDQRFAVSRVEADRPGLSYTVDTLAELHAQRPGDDLTFIVGGDMAHSLPTWREPRRVLSLARLGVAERVGVRRTDIEGRLAVLSPPPGRVAFFEMPRIDISSSLVRRLAAEGRSVRYLVPDAVAKHITATGLYRPLTRSRS